jgi:hypothetical protein
LVPRCPPRPVLLTRLKIKRVAAQWQLATEIVRRDPAESSYVGLSIAMWTRWFYAKPIRREGRPLFPNLA